MIDLEEEFKKWFYQNEGFALRAERFYDDLRSQGAMVAREWLLAAFKQGYMISNVKASTTVAPSQENRSEVDLTGFIHNGTKVRVRPSEEYPSLSLEEGIVIGSGVNNGKIVSYFVKFPDCPYDFSFTKEELQIIE